jgi:hypothetical protein
MRFWKICRIHSQSVFRHPDDVLLMCE